MTGENNLSDLIDIQSYPVQATLKVLLQDKTTKQNIIWATDAYMDHGAGCADTAHISEVDLCGVNSVVLKPRVNKAIEEQMDRTRKKAEVMTPVWLCNNMNNYCDTEWFGRENVFNIECSNHEWDVVDAHVFFPDGKTWQQYVDSRRLEITCGEAPYLVSRYDVATGEMIFPPFRRIGILDRKLRIVNENAESEDDWIKWYIRAFQSCYGYEYQGDNLLIARINLIMTFYEYYKDYWKKEPERPILSKIANIISWNIWQMDGLKDTTPLGKPYEENRQMNIFEYFENEGKEVGDEQEDKALPCKIMNWRDNDQVIYKTLKEIY